MHYIKRKVKYHIKKEVRKKISNVVKLGFLMCIISVLVGCNKNDTNNVHTSAKDNLTEQIPSASSGDVYGNDLDYYDNGNYEFSEVCNIPEYNGTLSVVINNNVPQINIEDAENGYFIQLSEQDELGRCGVAYMCVDYDKLPTEERGEIGHIKPSGWHTVKYPEQIPDLYLYNRCHLLMYALSGLNDDERNLITGTRQFNADTDGGMLYYENIVLDYVTRTKNHVLYRVTPIYDGDNLVAKGVQMEALSVEDDAVSFNVFVYNVQNGIEIDYKTGESWVKNDYVKPNAENEYIEEISDNIITNDITEDIKVEENDSLDGLENDENTEYKYILNTNTMKIHLTDCDSVNDISENNKIRSNDDIDILMEEGYVKCKRCF